ncbi:phosphoribosylanthranilate isomerase [Temperatibacter marinus]|uniref:N-(5'-phosphoribosyl)anthranilate isomerase n=1 Tax=Temperatibacter marinus TaxID=1456591 RepID=A0AA52EKZ7_9PROT|nr:phosphoribosylanthranilate isomerase [Temperatibacter marinus]WND03941.1 phosphoribosylanthranilate isomerase [Temperatibacter marinus]
MTQSSVSVKICGITTMEAAEAAAEAGAAYLGFISFPKSPRHLTLSKAQELGKSLPQGPARVGVFVNAAEQDILEMIEALDLTHLQFHGHESPEHIRALKDKTGLQTIKALAIADSSDLEKAVPYYKSVDFLLFDAKPPKGSDLPGGNNVSLPWALLRNLKTPLPWFVAGGIHRGNMHEAVHQSHATMIDISSGVESKPGLKDIAKIKALLYEIKQMK